MTWVFPDGKGLEKEIFKESESILGDAKQVVKGKKALLKGKFPSKYFLGGSEPAPVDFSQVPPEAVRVSISGMEPTIPCPDKLSCSWGAPVPQGLASHPTEPVALIFLAHERSFPEQKENPTLFCRKDPSQGAAA